jgi:eukaryotic-like serine/threonine-protein kinase
VPKKPSSLSQSSRIVASDGWRENSALVIHMVEADDDRFAEVLATYLEAWEAGRDVPADTPVDAGTFADRLAKQRLFFEQVRQFRRPAASNAVVPEELPKTIGRFQIIRELGRGGFGIVFLAYDPKLNRNVALKVPRAEVLVTPELRQRFVREARAASSLDHPNLVQVYDAGEAGPLCWIASAFVDGPTLAHWIEEQGGTVPTKTAVRFVKALAEGLHHAHQRRVLHCDVKPSNVLLARDESGIDANHVKLTDFGLAQLTNTDDGITQTGQLLGTPAYMAPEQAAGRREDLSPATDVWALGIVLYELLTGAPPFIGDRMAILHSVQYADVPSIRSKRKAVSRSLEAVCLKCLEKKPADRYRSALDLSKHLQQILAGESFWPFPVWRRPVRWFRRHSSRVALAAAIAVAAIAVGVATWPQEPPPVLEQPLAPNTVYGSELRAAGDMWNRGELDSLWEALTRHRVDERMEDVREFTWYYLWHQAGRDRLIRIAGVARPGSEIVVTPDGSECVAVGDDNRVRRFKLATGRNVRTSGAFPIAQMRQTALSADGRCLAAVDEDGRRRNVTVWDVETGKELMRRPSLGLDPRSRCIGMSRDGRWVAYGGRTGTGMTNGAEVWLWDKVSDESARIWEGILLACMQFSFDGAQLLITGTIPDQLHREQLQHFAVGESGAPKLLYAPPTNIPYGPALMGFPDGDGCVFSFVNGAIGIMRPFGPPPTRFFTLPKGNGHRIVIDLDGRTFACYAKEQLGPDSPAWLSFWDAASLQEKRRSWKVDYPVDGTAYTRDGGSLIVGSAGGLRCISVDEITEHQDIKNSIIGTDTRAVAYSPGAKVFASGGDLGRIRLWDAQTGIAVEKPPPGHTALVSCLAWSGQGSFLVSGGYDHFIRVWYANGTQGRTFKGHARDLRCVAVSPDEKTIASGAKDRTVRLWNVETGEQIGDPIEHTEQVNAVVFTKDGDHFISTSDDGKIQFWNWKERQRVDLRDESAALMCAAISADGRTLATGGRTGHVTLWTVESNSLVAKDQLRANGEILSVAFSPDGKTLAAGGGDKVVHLYQIPSGLELLTLKPTTAQINCLSFSPDGTRLSAALHDGTIRTWYAPKVDVASPFGP